VDAHDAAEFIVTVRHPQWIQRRLEAIERVADLWRGMGISFPVAELGECL
jgi:hypothetical protein